MPLSRVDYEIAPEPEVVEGIVKHPVHGRGAISRKMARQTKSPPPSENTQSSGKTIPIEFPEDAAALPAAVNIGPGLGLGKSDAMNAGGAGSMPTAKNAGNFSDFDNRFDSAAAGSAPDAGNFEELHGLLDRSLTLLESVSRHPALRDYTASKQRLDEIEQRLGYGAYPQ